MNLIKMSYASIDAEAGAAPPFEKNSVLIARECYIILLGIWGVLMQPL
jgi:hypothetical protein